MAFLPPYPVKPIAIAQQGRTDLCPKVLFYYQLKKIIQNMHSKCNTDPTWGPVMTISMGKANMEVLSAAERD
jgi:hypothetical protein